MLLLPSRNRPEAIQQLIDAMESTGCVPEAAVMIDGPVKPYQSVRWPGHWHIHHDTTHLEVVGALNALFQLYPNEKSYGFITDHGRPLSNDWATKMEEAAGDWNIALCDDSHNRVNPLTGYRRITSASWYGGELCRTLGWVWPEYFVHFYGDDVWEEIGHACGLIKYLPEVKVKDLLASRGEFPVDENNKRLWRGQPYHEYDRKSFEKWRSGQKVADIAKVREKLPPKNAVTVACVKWGSMYSSDYVKILFDMVRRNLPDGFPGKFVCFTDDAQGIDEGIEIRELPEGLTGWWNKLYLFKEGVFQEGERIVYIDLDTIITGPLDDIFNYNGDFAILADFYRPQGYGSGLMAWKGGFGKHIWRSFEAAGYPNLDGGDQAWIEQIIPKADRWQELFPGQVKSFKADCRYGAPKGTRIVCFHGQPKPDNCGEEWVSGIWKIGGGTSMEMVTVGNVTPEQIESNIRHALTLNLPLIKIEPAHDGHAVIIGGGPSLGNDLEEIRWRQQIGQSLFATNNSYRYLAEHEIPALHHVMVDGREENAAFVPDNHPLAYYASHCHPAVFEKANGPIALWHPLSQGILHIVGKVDSPLIGGGSTIVLNTMALAYVLGYRELHLYGVDSCYAETHHAYPQALNDNERVLDIQFNGKSYRAAPWMVRQAEEFRDLAAVLTQNGCLITVHGSGLLPDMASHMQNAAININH